jgi:hypothetical protein
MLSRHWVIRHVALAAWPWSVVSVSVSSRSPCALRLAESRGPQGRLVRSASGTAARELAVDDQPGSSDHGASVTSPEPHDVSGSPPSLQDFS